MHNALIDRPVTRRAPVTGDRLFYTGMGVAAAVAVFVGFAPTFYLRARYEPTPLPPYLAIHGVVFTSWILLFIVQTALVAARRTAVHRRLGWVGAALAALMVVVGLTAGTLSMRREIAAANEEAALTFFTTPVSSMLLFGSLVGAAIVRRRDAETHKRLMLLATLSILDAAVARWPLAVVSSELGFYALTDMFLLAAIVYDGATRRRLSPVYLWGGVLIVAVQSLRTVVGESAAWQAFARAVLE